MPTGFLADLATQLDPRRCSDIIAGMPAEQIAAVAEVLAVADVLPVQRLRGLAAEAIELGVEDMLPDVVGAAGAAGLWTPALRLLVALGPDLHRRLAPLAADLPAGQRAEAHAHAQELGLLGDLGVLGEALAK